MLEIRLFRENPEIIKKDLEKRNRKDLLPLVAEIVELDKDYRELLQKSQSLRSRRNELTEQVKKLKFEKKEAEAKKIIAEANKVPEQIKEIEAIQNELKEKLDSKLLRIPNLLHESVPVGRDDSENKVERIWGKEKAAANKNLIHHGELAVKLNLADFTQSSKISGAGFFTLKGGLALMELALQRLAIDHLLGKGFTLILAPFMLKKDAYQGVTDMDDFENVMYKVDGGDLYLIATSEHSLVSLHKDGSIDAKKLPLKYIGLSPCFRKEIGKHSIDERGLFRVHQFNKVEQVVFCHPKDSWKIHEELLKNSEELLQQLEIPYRVVNVCTGDMGTVAAKKYDIEAYSPREDKYVELMSCSNVLTYQAVRSNIKFKNADGSKEYLHTLNNTAIATSRALRIILEHYQTPEGTVKVPKALQKYMNNLIELKKE
ncbi:MAG TPA: serine--tRNA ligase [archaeon]|nr:serine--tRNA ligase [archaeon]